VPRMIQPRTMIGICNGSKDMAEARRIGLVHAGRRPARTMLMDEDSDSRNYAHLVRGLLLVWSIPFSPKAGVALGRELGKSSKVVQVGGHWVYSSLCLEQCGLGYGGGHTVQWRRLSCSSWVEYSDPWHTIQRTEWEVVDGGMQYGAAS
jgi:hypothetical protein